MSAITHSNELSAALLDAPEAVRAPGPAEPSVTELATETLAPVRLFATGRVDVVEELAFRALFLGAALITFYGLVSAF